MGGPCCQPPWSPGIASGRQGNVEPLGPCRGVQGPVMLFGSIVPGSRQFTASKSAAVNLKIRKTPPSLFCR